MVRPDLTFGRPPGVSAPGGPLDSQTETESHLGTSKRYLRPNWSSIDFLAGFAIALAAGLVGKYASSSDTELTATCPRAVCVKDANSVLRRSIELDHPRSAVVGSCRDANSCWQPAGKHPDDDQCCCRSPEHDRIPWLDVEQQ